jgi:hypothetical protein
LHHKVDEVEELFKFTELVGLFRLLKNVEPAFANISEARLNDLLETEDPAGFTGRELESANT